MYSVEQLNTLADKLEQEGMVSEKSLVAPGAKATPGEIITQICKVYQKVKPFLEVYTSLFFLPKKWKTPVITFMAFMEGLCPSE